MIIKGQEKVVEDVVQSGEQGHGGKDACAGHVNGGVSVRKQWFPDHES
jgi:hypothetical protein